MLTSW